VTRSKWISIRSLKIHEFHRTIRYLRRAGKSWHDIFLRLGEMQAEATHRFLKTLSSVLVTYLLIQSLGKGTLVSFTFSSVTASVPVAYVAAVGAVSLFLAFQQLQSVLMIIAIRGSESARPRLPGFSSNMYGLFHGQDELALSVPVLVNSFMKERIPNSALLSILSMIVYFSFLLPLFAFSMFLVSWQMHVIYNGSAPKIEIAAALLGIFVVAQTYFYVFIFNFPFPMKKNVSGIRWGFLSTLHPLGRHPQIKKWIEDTRNNKP
jgi:hypothetical protein